MDLGYQATVSQNAKVCFLNGETWECGNNGLWVCNGSYSCDSNTQFASPCTTSGDPGACGFVTFSSLCLDNNCYNACDLSGGSCDRIRRSVSTNCCVGGGGGTNVTGFHDGTSGNQQQSNCNAYGWAKDPDNLDQDVFVRFLVDGTSIASWRAGNYRGDLLDDCTGGTCAYGIDLWPLISRNTDHQIAVQAQDLQSSEWRNLDQTPRTLHCCDTVSPDVSASLTTVNQCTNYTISWTSSNALSCSLTENGTQISTSESGSVVRNKTTAGSYSYVLTCTNACGISYNDTVVVDVMPTTADINIVPVSIGLCTNYAVTWSSSRATDCSITGPNSPQVGLSGSVTENKTIAGTYGYNITCANNCGINAVSDNDSISVLQTTADINIVPDSVGLCTNYAVSWTSTGATDCSVTGTDPSRTGLTGTATENKTIAGTYGYNITCADNCGTGAVSDNDSVVVSPMSCGITIDPPSLTGLSVGVRTSVKANITETGGTVDNVVFDVTPDSPVPAVARLCSDGVAGLCPVTEDNVYTDNFSTPFSANLSIDNSNYPNSILRARGLMNECGVPVECSALSLITLNTRPAWFQTIGGNVVSRGGIVSKIPATAVNRNFIRDPFGLLIYSSGTPPDLGSGFISSSGINSNTLVSTLYAIDFDTLYGKKLPSDILIELNKTTSPCPSNLRCQYPSMTSIPAANLASCTTVRGYKVCYYDGSTAGDLTLTGNFTIPNGDRIILFVDNTNVTIAGSIKPQTLGRSSFLLVSDGNITIDSAVGGSPSDGVADLEGVFYADGVFSTGSVTVGNDSTLHIRGSVSAGSYLLERDRGDTSNLDDNEYYPGEIFEYGIEQTLAFPPFLRLRTTSWKEVAP